jgi:cobalt-zinc-cadmium efflux system protein
MSRQHSYHRAFAWGVALNIAFVIAEVVFGLWADSLALLADAGHNLSDVLSLILAWGASVLARVTPSRKRTYGWRGSTIMAALINALVLMAAIGAIAWEALRRLGDPSPVGGPVIIIVAGVGLIVNAATALFFFHGRKSDLNIRGAFLHMAADAGVSAGVVLAGTAIMYTGWLWLDPAASLLIAVVIFVGAWGLLRDSVNLAMQAVPREIDAAEVEGYLLGLPEVKAVHDLHIWALSTSEIALTAHLVKPDPAGDDDFLAHTADALKQRFNIDHTTLQLERSLAACAEGACQLESG